MARLRRMCGILMMVTAALGLFAITGCKKAGTSSAVAGGTDASPAKLQETLGAVQEAEKKLDGLRSERAQLEKDLEARKSGK